MPRAPPKKSYNKIAPTQRSWRQFQGIKHVVPDQTLKKQLDDIYMETRQAITNTDALHNKKKNSIARLRTSW